MPDWRESTGKSQTGRVALPGEEDTDDSNDPIDDTIEDGEFEVSSYVDITNFPPAVVSQGGSFTMGFTVYNTASTTLNQTYTVRVRKPNGENTVEVGKFTVTVPANSQVSKTVRIKPEDLALKEGEYEIGVWKGTGSGAQYQVSTFFTVEAGSQKKNPNDANGGSNSGPSGGSNGGQGTGNGMLQTIKDHPLASAAGAGVVVMALGKGGKK